MLASRFRKYSYSKKKKKKEKLGISEDVPLFEQHTPSIRKVEAQDFS